MTLIIKNGQSQHGRRLTVVPSEKSLEDHDEFFGHDRLMSLLRTKDSGELVTQVMIEMAERTGISGVLPKTEI